MSRPPPRPPRARGRGNEAQHVLDVRIVRLVQPELQRVAVERAQALDRLVVVELARRARGIDDRPRADDEIGDDRRAAAPPVRVHPALVRIDVVLGDELARLAAERRIVGEADPLLHPDRPGPAVVGDLGRRGGGQRRELRRRREVVPLVERLEDRHQDLERRVVGVRLRIERVDVGRGEPQHLRRIGRVRGPGEEAQRERQQETSAMRLRHASFRGSDRGP